MPHFEVVSRFKDAGLELPARATHGAAAYDLCVAEDIVIKPYDFFSDKVRMSRETSDYYSFNEPFTLEQVADLNKELKSKVQLVSTGMRAIMAPDEYLEIVPRSSTPLKHWLIQANGVGVIDSDYSQSDNEGEIFFQFINLWPYAIQLKKGDRIGQAIFHKYLTTDDDGGGAAARNGGFGSTSEG